MIMSPLPPFKRQVFDLKNHRIYTYLTTAIMEMETYLLMSFCFHFIRECPYD